MDVFQTALNAGVVAAIGLLLGWLAKGRFDAIDRRFEDLEHRMDERFGEVHGRIDRLEERIETRIEGVRSDLTRLALAVGAGPRAENA